MWAVRKLAFLSYEFQQWKLQKTCDNIVKKAKIQGRQFGPPWEKFGTRQVDKILPESAWKKE